MSMQVDHHRNVLSLFWILVSLAIVSSISCGGETEEGSSSDADLETGDEDGGGEPGTWPTGKYIAPDEVYERWEAGDEQMLLVNVVDEEFYDLGHIEGSLVIPWDLLPDRLDEVDPTRYVVIYCRLGVRSENAYTTLDGAGYEHIWIMDGGLSAWTELGYPVEGN